MPELFIAMIILFVYTIILSLYDGITSKKQEKCDNNTAKKVIFISNIIVISISVMCVILSAFTLITAKTGDIPENSDGKYLDIHDFGIADKITETGYKYSDKEIPNKITVKKTVTAQLTLTHEHYDIGDKSVFIFQDILEYKNEKTALKVAELLSSREYEHYKEYQTEGFSKVYISDEDIIAAIDNTVYRVTIITEKSKKTRTHRGALITKSVARHAFYNYFCLFSISSSLRASRFCIGFPPIAADIVPVSSETTIAIASFFIEISPKAFDVLTDITFPLFLYLVTLLSLTIVLYNI